MAVVPCYRVRAHILDVLSRIGPECSRIYVVDDACPEGSGRHVEEHCKDPRVRVIYHEKNLGVGGAVITGYRHAVAAGAKVVVKIDGDGQMAPEFLPAFVQPILNGDADYTKGNRFFRMEDLRQMPWVRVIGNAGLSFMTKLSSGYWSIFDPTNGYTAIHSSLIRWLPLDKISKRYFFESDLLFHLNILRAKVVDIPMTSSYGAETSNLKPGKVAVEFFLKSMRNAFKRIFFNYFLRDFSLATLQLVFGTGLLLFGVIFGTLEWRWHVQEQTAADTGTVMLAALPVILGIQLLLSFVGYDMSNVPRECAQEKLRHADIPAAMQGGAATHRLDRP